MTSRTSCPWLGEATYPTLLAPSWWGPGWSRSADSTPGRSLAGSDGEGATSGATARVDVNNVFGCIIMEIRKTQLVRDQLFGAGRAEQPLTPVSTAVGIALSALATFQSSTDPVAGQGSSDRSSFGILTTYPPTLCGLATLGAALARGLTAYVADISVVRGYDGSPSPSTRVIGEPINGSPAAVAVCVELLDQSDVAVIQHHGVDGDEVVIDPMRSLSGLPGRPRCLVAGLTQPKVLAAV
jgi:hypothetical protein